MTKEEAREELITFIGTFECPSLEAVEMAIEALKREDTMLKEIERVVLYGERSEE